MKYHNILTPKFLSYNSLETRYMNEKYMYMYCDPMYSKLKVEREIANSAASSRFATRNWTVSGITFSFVKCEDFRHGAQQRLTPCYVMTSQLTSVAALVLLLLALLLALALALQIAVERVFASRVAVAVSLSTAARRVPMVRAAVVTVS